MTGETMAAATKPQHPGQGPIEDLAESYLASAGGDARAALRAVIVDALADQAEMERQTRLAMLLVSRGYARGAVAVGPLRTDETQVAGR